MAILLHASSPMTDKDFEKLVLRLIDELRSTVSPLAGAEVRGGSKNRIRGASGFPHQIDVSFQVEGTILIIECKRWREPIDAGVVLACASRLADVRAANHTTKVLASVVSTKRSTRGAKQLAAYFGISLDQVANAREYGIRLSNYVFGTAHGRLTLTGRAEGKVVSGHAH